MMRFTAFTASYLPNLFRPTLFILLSSAVASATAVVAHASALDDWRYETTTPAYYYTPNGTLFFPDADSACAATMPRGNPLITYSDPRAAYRPDYGLGCEYKVTWTDSTGFVIDVNNNWFGQHWIEKGRACPTEFTYDPSTSLCRRLRAAEENSCPVGNPLYPGRGIKTQLEYDYRESTLDSSLIFARQYSSWHFKPYFSSIGNNWFVHIFGRYLTIDSGVIIATRGLSETKAFNLQGAVWVAKKPGEDTFEAFTDSSGNAWRYFDASRQAYEYYNSAGVLLRIEHTNGNKYTLEYSDSSTPSNIAPRAGLLLISQKYSLQY